jgi:hypothetical protein
MALIPHQDLALANSLFSLWSEMDSAIRSAVIAVHPVSSDSQAVSRASHLPSSATDADIVEILRRSYYLLIGFIDLDLVG